MLEAIDTLAFMNLDERLYKYLTDKAKVIGDTEPDPRAILLCGGAQGMAMAANRFRGIRASVIWDAYEAKMTRNDNDSNILCLPARVLENDDQAWKGILETWLNTPFANATRYNRRNAQIDEI